MKLEKSIKELHDMFMDMAMLVESQVCLFICKQTLCATFAIKCYNYTL